MISYFLHGGDHGVDPWIFLFRVHLAQRVELKGDSKYTLFSKENNFLDLN